MLRVAIIGPGDVEFHFYKLLKLHKEAFWREVESVAKALAISGAELLIVPDRGVPFEVAKFYKKHGGKKVIGAVPFSDKIFGIKHLEGYLESGVIDETMGTGDWYRQSLSFCMLGDAVLMLGSSLGSMMELAGGFYLYKLVKGKKKGVKAGVKGIHPHARAGEGLPLSIIVYMPFMKEKLNFEVSAYVKKTGGEVYYVESGEELEKLVKRLEDEKGKNDN